MYKHWLPFYLVLFFILSFQRLSYPGTEGTSNATFDSTASYLAHLIQQAEEKKLYEKKYWQILLHYKSGIWGVTSEVDGQDFFLASEGKTNPEAELYATLKGFFSPLGKDKPEDHPRCRFIARYSWLKSQLNIDTAYLDDFQCPFFPLWKKEINAKSLSIIFPSYHMGSPASMFGHTLLRFNSDDEGEGALTDYAVNFAAEVDLANTNPLFYSAMGLFGGYNGKFSLLPYYIKVREYTDFESRDIWEYHLNLTLEEIDRLLQHLWELQRTYFDYYFFKENCSYHLLSLLEAARPSLKLQENYILWTIPSDTIKDITKEGHLIDRRKYRPSRLSKLKQKYNRLTEDEKRLFSQLITMDIFALPEKWDDFHEQKQARILDALVDYSILQEEEGRSKMRQVVLRNRAKLRIKTNYNNLPPASTPPEIGHESMRMGMGGGVDSNDNDFAEFTIRFSYHDLLGNDSGYLPNSQIEMFHLKTRYYGKGKNFRLEELRLINVISIVPRNNLYHKMSWRAYSGIKRDYAANGVVPSIVFQLSGGGGMSYSIGDLVFFTFLEVNGLFNWEKGENSRLEYGASVNALYTAHSKLKFFLSYSGYQTTDSDLPQYQKASIEFAVHPSNNSDIRLGGELINRYREGKLSFNLYF